MRNYYYKPAVLVFAFLVLMLTSCNTEKLEVSVSSLVCDNSEEPQLVEISSNVDWSISCNDAWISFFPASGNGSAQVQVIAKCNSSSANRESYISVTGGSEGQLLKNVTIRQEVASLQFDQDTLYFEKEGGTQDFSFKSNSKWSATFQYISGNQLWITSLDPTSGIGDGSITITAAPSELRLTQKAEITFSIGTKKINGYIVLQPKPNSAPEKPLLVYPEEGAIDVPTNPAFIWKESSDPDGDAVNYSIYYSTDKSTWTAENTTKTEHVFNKSFQTKTKYYWKVVADDGNGKDNSLSESDIQTFSTCSKDGFDDGEYYVYQSSSKSRPVYLVFTGDGYVGQDHQYGGAFQSDIEEGIEALFSVEPYKSYREYFTVFVIAAYSQQRGISIGVDDYVNTKFGVVKGEGTGMTCNDGAVFSWVKKIPEITDDELPNTSIALICNKNIYAGTCFIYDNGSSIGIVPVSREGTDDSMTHYHSIILHEFGGHGFGLLADEYTVYDKYIPEKDGESNKKDLLYWQDLGFFHNVSVTSDLSLVPWSMLVGLEGYDRVGAFQGAYYYKYGVWRSETTSCMIDNLHYYNAKSRQLIVKRILSVSEEGYTFEKFLEKDIEKEPKVSAAPQYPVSKSSDFVPLGPPKMHSKRY